MTCASVLLAGPLACFGLWVLWKGLFDLHTTVDAEDLTSAADLSLWLAPGSLAAVALAIKAKGHRRFCLPLALVFPVCWLVVWISGKLR